MAVTVHGGGACIICRARARHEPAAAAHNPIRLRAPRRQRPAASRKSPPSRAGRGVDRSMMPRLAAGLAAAPDFKAGKAMPTRSRTRRAFANLHETLNWDSELPTLVAAEGPSLRNYAPINLSLIGRSSLPVPANWQPQWQMARGRRCAAGPPPTHSESLAP
jgi:hypothetical protein